MIRPPARTAVETVRIAARARTAPTGVARTTACESSSIDSTGVERRKHGARQASRYKRAVPAGARQLKLVEAAS